MALDIIPKQEDGKLKAVASGTLPSGQPVVVNADGTVSVVATSSISQSIGTAATVNTGTSGDITASYDSVNNKVVVAYRDESNSNYGTAAVGTVTGTSLSFGSEVVFSSDYSGAITSTYDVSAGKFVVFYINSSSFSRCKVGTVSGTSISFGSEVTVTDTTTYGLAATYDTVNQKVVYARENGNSNGRGAVGTVSGTSISFGSEVTFNSAQTTVFTNSLQYNPASGSVVVAYRDRGNSEYGTAVVGTVSGTSISFGSEVVFNTANTQYISVSSDETSSSVVVSYKDTGGSLAGEAVVGTISGTSISFGSATQFSTGEVNRLSSVYNVVAKKHLVFFPDQGSSTKGFFCEGTVSGTSISFSDPVEYEAGTTIQATGAAYIADEKVVVNAFADNSDSGKGKAVAVRSAYDATNLTSENYIGMSGGAVDANAIAASAGSAAVFESAAITFPSATYDSVNNKVVIAYEDDGNSNYGTAVVGTVSGDTITFGTPVVFESATTNYYAAVYDANAEKIVIAYEDVGNSSYGTAIVGTVSGTSISFGTAAVFESAESREMAAAYDANAQKVVIAYRDGGNSDHGTAVVGTVSGTSISFGTAAVFESATTNDISVVYDATAEKVVVVYQDNGNSGHGTAAVGTVSGTSISFGTPVVFEAAGVSNMSAGYDTDAGKVCVAYRDTGNSNYGTAIIGTVSGTSISFGTAVVFNEDSVSTTSTAYDPNAQKIVITYRDNGNSGKGTAISGAVSGDSISFDTAFVFVPVSGSSYDMSNVYDANAQKIVIPYRDASNSSYGTAVVYQTPYTDITRGEVADGDAATVDIVGTVSTNQVSLTAGQQYYVQTDGTIGTTPADPSVLAGTAVSATKMVVKS